MTLSEAIKRLFSEEIEEPVPHGRRVKIEANSLDDAIRAAAQLLGTVPAKVEFKILEPGGKVGLFKKREKKWKILAWRKDTEEEEVEGAEETVTVTDLDGTFKLKITKKGIFLIVYPQVGNGSPVSEDQVYQELISRGIYKQIDPQKVAQAIKEASGKPVRIGDWVPNPEWDSKAVVELSEDEMQAYLTIIPPRKGGRVLEYEDILEALAQKGVKVGVKHDVIRRMLTEEIYNKPMLVAEGVQPVPGKDAQIEFKIKISKEIELIEREDGTVDFRELGIITNVVKNQVLAVKIPATEGIPGRTVTDKVIPVPPGKDVPLPKGKNTEITPDGLKLIATIDGHAVYRDNKIHVEPIFEVRGGVGVETGNIVFLGNVVVWGDVQDGYEVRAGGDVVIHGNVGKCIVEAGNNVIVDGGIHGKGEGVIKAKNDIVAKFVDQATLDAERDILVQEYILHSTALAGRSVFVHGKLGRIVGGQILAKEEIRGRTLGSKAGVRTILQVGYEPHKYSEREETFKEYNARNEELKKLEKDFEVFKRKKARRMLKGEEEEQYRILEAKIVELKNQVADLKEKLETLDSYLAQNEAEDPSVSASHLVYSGVQVVIKGVSFTVRKELTKVTFVLEKNAVVVKPYRPRKLTLRRWKKK